MNNINLLDSLILTLLTLIIYQIIAWAQQKWQLIWLNPMLISIAIVVPYLLLNNIPYSEYRQSTQMLNALLEPAIVALGYPLYLQLQHIRKYWRQLLVILSLGVVIVMSISFIMTMLIINQQEIAISLSLKSITTPVGIALTEQLHGDSSITAIAIIIAGFSGGLLGPSWLKLCGIKSDAAIGLDIGSASHVIGSMLISKKNPNQGAYSSVSLITSALLTAFIVPLLIPLFLVLFS